MIDSLLVFLDGNGKPTAFLWAICIIFAIIVFAIIIFVIFRLYGKSPKKKSAAETQTANSIYPYSTSTPYNEMPKIEPLEFQKRNDNTAIPFSLFDDEKAKEEQKKIDDLLLEEDKKRKDAEAKELAQHSKLQKQEEERLEKERREQQRQAEKDRLLAEKMAAKEAKNAAKNNSKNFFTDWNQPETGDTFNFIQPKENKNKKSNDVVDFWNTSSEPAFSLSSESAVAPVDKQSGFSGFATNQAPTADPRIEKVLSEIESQKQSEQEKFAKLMAELENQKQETARLKDELSSKQKSDKAIDQAKLEMEQMIRESQDKINRMSVNKEIESIDKSAVNEIKEILAAEREAQEKRLREQENSLAAVIAAMENERRVKEENQLYSREEERKQNEFVRMQNQYQDAILQMQEKFEQALMEAKKKTNDDNMNNIINNDERNSLYSQIERERNETVSLIQQMQREVEKMNSEREAERKEFEQRKNELDSKLEEALKTQRLEFQTAQKQAETANVEQILKDIENQRMHEQEMFANILNELAAGREDTKQAKIDMEHMMRESEDRINRLENQQTNRGLDDDTLVKLKDILSMEREAQEKRLAENENNLNAVISSIEEQQKSINDEQTKKDAYQKAIEEMKEKYESEIANLRSFANVSKFINNATDVDDDDSANHVEFTAKKTKKDDNSEVLAKMDKMQSEIEKLEREKAEEREEFEKRYAALADALSQSIYTGQNSAVPENLETEKASVEKILQDIEHQKQLEQERFSNIMNELAAGREDTKKAKEAMEQIVHESENLISQLSSKTAVRGIDDETLSVLKDLLALEREAQEKRLAENEKNLGLVINTIEEQQKYMADEQQRQAVYETTIAEMREKYEQELDELKKKLTVKNSTLESVKKPEENDDDENNDGNADGEGEPVNEVEFTTEEEFDVNNQEILEQIGKMQEEIEKLEKAREVERFEFEHKYAELNKVLEESLKVQRLEVELEKEKQLNEFKMNQALESQRMELQVEKERELAELNARKALEAQREELEAQKEEEIANIKESSNVVITEQTNAIIEKFKEQMEAQHQEFLALLNSKKKEEESVKQEFEKVMQNATKEDKEAVQEQYGIQEVMEQLLEERKTARLEAQALREELEAQRIETEAKLMKQLSEVKQGLVAELSSEQEIKEKFNSMEKEVENHTLERQKINEEEEARVKQEYEEFKKQIADDLIELEEKNMQLQAELEKTRMEKTLEDSKKAEYEENEKKLREKYMQLRSELSKEAQQVTKQAEEIEAEKQAIEDKKKDLEEEKIRLQNEVELLKQQVLEIATQEVRQTQENSEESVDIVRQQLEEEYKRREREMLDKVEKEKQALISREAQLMQKEANIEKEENRIKEQSQAVNTMITNRDYTKEERERIVLDYSQKLEDLDERLRQNEKALRENNREFIPLRRIKNTLDRDMKLLRKREAIVAKQEVLVYGVNNISTVDPEKIKKLEQDIKQLSGLQQSVANCEMILNKNKDRYPTLENLDKVLRAQNEQIRSDLEEVKAAIKMFGENNA